MYKFDVSGLVGQEQQIERAAAGFARLAFSACQSRFPPPDCKPSGPASRMSVEIN